MKKIELCLHKVASHLYLKMHCEIEIIPFSNYGSYKVNNLESKTKSRVIMSVYIKGRKHDSQNRIRKVCTYEKFAHTKGVRRDCKYLIQSKIAKGKGQTTSNG